jgi:hypothetical protein
MNMDYLKVRNVLTKHENIKLINGEASSSTLVEELAVYTKGIIKKLIKFIKIKVLTKELKFRAPKTQKNMKTQDLPL